MDNKQRDGNLVSELTDAALIGSQHRNLERRLDAEGLIAAKKMFEPIRDFLNELEAALEQATGFKNQVVEQFWMVGPERENYSGHYLIASHAVAFFVSGDFKRISFVQQTFRADDIDFIKKAVKEWVVELLRSRA